MADEGHVNHSKKVGGRNFEEEFGQALFFVSPTPHYVPRETKIEPDRRLGVYRKRISRKGEISVLLQIIFCSCAIEFTLLVDLKNSENTKKGTKF